jgi:L-ascorbate metabolism protein UlaG (beta-lactamase superfamily)
MPKRKQHLLPDGKTELLWLGQAGFRIKTPGGKIIVD